jgi:4-carboxymuconolactone decarboxylase
MGGEVEDELEQRFRRGIEMMRVVAGDDAADRVVSAHDAPHRDVPEEMLDWAVTNSFGFLFQRDGISMRDRSLVLVAVDIAMLRSSGALREHVGLALHSGVTADELYEICFLLVWYCGMPTVREAMVDIRRAVEESRADTPGAGGDPERDQ